MLDNKTGTLTSFFEGKLERDLSVWRELSLEYFNKDFKASNRNFQSFRASQDWNVDSLELDGSIFSCYGYFVITPKTLIRAKGFLDFLWRMNGNAKVRSYLEDLMEFLPIWQCSDNFKPLDEEIHVLTARKSVASQSGAGIGEILEETKANVLILSYLDKTPSYSAEFIVELSNFFKHSSLPCTVEFIGDHTRISRIPEIAKSLGIFSVLYRYNVIVGEKPYSFTHMVDGDTFKLVNNRFARAVDKLTTIYSLALDYKVSLSSVKQLELLAVEFETLLLYNGSIREVIKYLFRKVQSLSRDKDIQAVKRKLLVIEKKNGNHWSNWKELKREVLKRLTQ